MRPHSTAMSYCLFFFIADSSVLLCYNIGVITQAERRGGDCVENHNQAVTHELLQVSQFLIKQQSHTKHAHAFLLKSFFHLSFPLCVSLTLCLDLENLWCHDFAWWKRTRSSSPSYKNPSSQLFRDREKKNINPPCAVHFNKFGFTLVPKKHQGLKILADSSDNVVFLFKSILWLVIKTYFIMLYNSKPSNRPHAL